MQYTTHKVLYIFISFLNIKKAFKIGSNPSKITIANFWKCKDKRSRCLKEVYDVYSC